MSANGIDPDCDLETFTSWLWYLLAQTLEPEEQEAQWLEIVGDDGVSEDDDSVDSEQSLAEEVANARRAAGLG